MDNLIIHHQVIEKNGETTILLYVNPQLTEFSSELGTPETNKSKSFEKHIREYIKKNLKATKANSIKVLLGSMVLSQLVFPSISPKQVEAAEFNMSYLFFGSTSQQINFVDQTQKAVDTVSPSYFDINADGTLDISNQFSPTFINEMKARNVKITPFLSNHWDRNVGRAALQNRELLSTQIADTIIKYDLDGVNIDIENVTEVDRANYTDLVRLINEKLPADKEVSVAVAANPYGWTQGWHGSYDYKKLSEYSDYLMVMAYDQSYYGGDPGPVASYNWVEKSIQYAINQGVPPNKIVLGMPFYGRYWNDQESVGGNGLSRKEAETLVKDFNGKITYDEASKSVKATFTIKESDPKPRISSRNLTAGNYTVWYEDERSIQAKIDLVHQYNLKGTGSWALGQENPAMWNSYDLWLEGTPFRDINTHWAKNDIIEINNKGWMVGVDNNVFGPEQKLTRAQAAVIIARALELDPVTSTTTGFQDVNSSHWASKEIATVRQYGLMAGVEEGKFAPDEPLTREQFAVILDRILVEKGAISEDVGKSASTFTDVAANRWSKESIVRMNQLGIVKGMKVNEFQPTGELTRAQMATMMNRASSFLES
ncbi:glycosyl hydrolase family 18 protein [Caldibacillus lycopersici]|uniref:Glycosyl hydrolase family 18 protein n=1 Tax=Perspicuibacillus lycopersici TaxID=1325689 RepID=A0AAE3IWW6_9BACI|nr:glycosyl hydrolase family 18 protein [Perspicuibacillus lycopersici]MCU9613545.1 glycosyl hydrolase family 18 protein [Perspicuibacillus lycopersici]